MAEVYVQTSGDFNEFGAHMREAAHEEIFRLLDRYKQQFRELNIHIHVKRLSSRLGSNALLRCSLNLFTEQARFHVVEEGFGMDAAIRNASLSLRYQIERHLEMRVEERERSPGRKEAFFEA